MTLIDALNNPTYRAMIDAIEDTLGSLDGKEGDTILEAVLAAQIADLKAATGINYAA